jgi:hypothetical protein
MNLLNCEENEISSIQKDGLKTSVEMKDFLIKIKIHHSLSAIEEFKMNYTENLKLELKREWTRQEQCSRCFLWSLSSSYDIESIIVENRVLFESDSLKLIKQLKEEESSPYKIYLQDIAFENDVQWLLNIRDEYFKIYCTTLQIKKTLSKASSTAEAKIQLNIGMICLKNDRFKAHEKKDSI